MQNVQFSYYKISYIMLCCKIYLKYFPVTLSNEGSSAAYSVVCAPCLGLLTNGHTRGRRKIAENVLLKKLICLIISVSTIPGCTEVAVTPVPAKP
jgi:hypothetical protein